MLAILIILIIASAILYLWNKEVHAQACFTAFMFVFIYSITSMAAESYNTRIREKAQQKVQTEAALRKVDEISDEVQKLRAELRGDFVELRASVQSVEMALESDVCLDSGVSR